MSARHALLFCFPEIISGYYAGRDKPGLCDKDVIPFGILVKVAFRGSEYFSQEKYLIRRLKTPLARIIFTYPSAHAFYCVIWDKISDQKVIAGAKGFLLPGMLFLIRSRSCEIGHAHTQQPDPLFQGDSSQAFKDGSPDFLLDIGWLSQRPGSCQCLEVLESDLYGDSPGF